jgi:hypothetical protein
VLGLLLGCGVGLCQGKEFSQIEFEIRRHGCFGVTDFLNNGVFHGCGLVRSSGVQMTGM